MELTPQILFGNAMHVRISPKHNNFSFKMYSLAFPLSKLTDLKIGHNKFAPISFYDYDHAYRDGTCPEAWVKDVLFSFGITKANGEIFVVCMPRVMGYSFNPFSFWLCHDKKGQLRAVLCEVHNLYDEHHTYVCVHDDQRMIQDDDVLKGRKIFYVTSHLPVEGHYDFQFKRKNGKFTVHIDHYSAIGKKKLVTTLKGELQPMTKDNLRKAFWGYPLITLKAILYMHWQALRLMLKGVEQAPKPEKNLECTSRVRSDQPERIPVQESVQPVFPENNKGLSSMA